MLYGPPSQLNQFLLGLGLNDPLRDRISYQGLDQARHGSNIMAVESAFGLIKGDVCAELLLQK